MSGLEHSLLQHGIEVSGWLLHPSGHSEEDTPYPDALEDGDRLQDQIAPPALLPNTLGVMLQQFAEELGDPAEAYYLVLLCVAASLIPSKTRLLVDPHSKFLVPPILWGGLMGCQESGGSIINMLTLPLEDLQEEHHAHYRQQFEEYEASLRAYREDLKRGNAGNRPQPPDRFNLYTTDCRADVVKGILASQPDHGLLIVPNNLATFLQESGAWPGGRRSDRSFWWRRYCGFPLKHRSEITSSTFTLHPSISVIGEIAHDPLRGLWKKRTRTDGDIWPCFAWVDVPPRHCAEGQESIPHSLRRLLVDVYRRLHASPPMQHELDEEGFQLWVDWREKLLDRIRNARNYKIRMLLIETVERAARIALVLHRLDAACIGVIPSVIVPASTLDRAMEFALHLQWEAETTVDYGGRSRTTV